MSREPTEVVTRDIESPWYLQKFVELDEEEAKASTQYTLHKRRLQRLKPKQGGFVTAGTLVQMKRTEQNIAFWHWRLVSIASRRKFLTRGYKIWMQKRALYRPPPALPRSDTIMLDDEGNVVYDRYDSAYDTEED